MPTTTKPGTSFGADDPTSSSAIATPAAAAISTSQRHQRRAKKPREIDLSRLPYIRLPMAPTVWEERHGRGSEVKKSDKSAPLFGLDTGGWSLDEPRPLAKSERPDPAFKQAFHTAGYSYWLDPKGRTRGYEHADGVLRVTDLLIGPVA
jgi:hypothetical protein